jgi:hypothetical protein
VYSLIVAGSVEERMLALQQKKRRLADGILGRSNMGTLGGFPNPPAKDFAGRSPASSTRNDGGGTPSLTAREVEGLFAPLDDPGTATDS